MDAVGRHRLKERCTDPAPAKLPEGVPALSPVRLAAPPIMAGYPGSKGASGVAERIIREMPPHSLYVEAFAGHAAVFRRKRAADQAVLIDADPAVCETLRAFTVGCTGVDVVCASALDYFQSFRWNLTASALVYFDPPYLRSVRTRLLYDFEFHTIGEHTKLLRLARELHCNVIISGYESPLYKKLLKAWRTVKIPAMTRGGKRVEWLWCNFEAPQLLHDPRFAGGDYRERENIARKQKRWVKKFAGMKQSERQAIAVALTVCDRPAVESAVRTVSADLARLEAEC